VSISRIHTNLVFISVLVFITLKSNAQNTLNGVVYSVDDKTPLENVHLLTSDTAVLTKANGYFNVKFDGYLEVFHIGYESVRFRAIDQIPDTIWLTRKNNILEEVVIRSKREVQKLEKESKYWLKDFEVAYDHLIVFKKSYLGSRNKLSLYDLDGKWLDDLPIEFEIQDLVMNCIGQLFVKYKFGYEMVFVVDGQLVKGTKYKSKKFDQIYGKCVLYYDGQWIYEFERYKGLERNIVRVKEHRDTLLKKIVLSEMLILKNRYQGVVSFGQGVSAMQTDDSDVSRAIRRSQRASDFLDNVVLKANETNSFAVLKGGLLIANAELDSLHYFSSEVFEKPFTLNKGDQIFNDIDKSRTFLLQKLSRTEYELHHMDNLLATQKILTLKKDIRKLRVHDNKVFYLFQDDSQNSVKINLHFESI